MYFLRALKTLAGIIAVLFIGVTATLFIGLPRVVNQLADLLGTGTEQPTHWLPVIIIWLVLFILAYFWVWRPWQQFTYAQKAQGLVVQRGQGKAYMDTESVRQQVYAAVVKVPDVKRVEVTISNDLGKAIVQLNILTESNINGPKKKQEISREVKKVVQDQLGVYLASEPTINLSLTPVGADVPHAVPDVAPQVAKSPSSPRTIPDEPPRRAIPEPAPLPRTDVVRPISRFERAEPPPPPVIPELKPEPKVEETKTTVTEETNNTTPDTPVASMRPFARRPFVAPAGSATLPDIPVPKEPADTPTSPIDETPADTLTTTTIVEEKTVSEANADNKDSSAS